MPGTRFILFAALAAFVLTGCSSIDQARGRVKKSPDEFEVVVNPSLSLPPGFSLRPITPDEARSELPGSKSADALIDTATGATTAGAAEFASIFGIHRAEAGIRNRVDEETLGIRQDRKLPGADLFGRGLPEVGPVLSPEEEARRIRDAKLKGEGLTDTPSRGFDPYENNSVTIE